MKYYRDRTGSTRQRPVLGEAVADDRLNEENGSSEDDSSDESSDDIFF